MAPITAARSTLAPGCTTITNATSTSPARSTANRGPISPADSNTAPQTMVTLAPDTAVRWVRPAVRNSAMVSGVTPEVSPSTRPGSIAAWSAGNTERAAAANRSRSERAARCTPDASPNAGGPVAVSTATLRSRRTGREMRARKRTGCPALRSAKPSTGAKTMTRPPVS